MPRLFKQHKAKVAIVIVAFACMLAFAFIMLRAWPFIALQLKAPKAQPLIIDHCKASQTLKPICGLQSPEDIIAFPHSDWLIFGEFSDMFNNPFQGSLKALHSQKHQLHTLYRAPKAPKRIARQESWGDPDCLDEPTLFSAHGIDAVKRVDGKEMLLVINHQNNHDRIEYFELNFEPKPKLTWRGCVKTHYFLNDLVALPTGNFYATHMMHREANFIELGKILFLRKASGYIIHYTKNQDPKSRGSFSHLENTKGAFPNGLTSSVDFNTLYINYWAENKTKVYDIKTKRIRHTYSIPGPDNISRSLDGSFFLVASQTQRLVDFLSCEAALKEERQQARSKTCGLPFNIIKLDPKNKSQSLVFEGLNIPFGAGTVGVQKNKQLFIGSFIGDRLLTLK